MRAISLFSGAGGFEIGFDRAGIDTVLQVESDQWCREVLARHWPDTERLSDVREVDAATQFGRSRDLARAGYLSNAERPRPTGWWRGNAGLVDLIYGGFPCQDVSVAGQRAGLRGERSGLWSEFARILSELRPRWCVIENVPGLLSSDNGRDFLRILVDLDVLGYGVAWRVLDGRWFGVPQRRRRVFLVGCLGDAQRAQAVLAVCESCGGHPQESREAGQDVAYTLAGGSPDTSRRISNGWNTTYLPTNGHRHDPRDPRTEPCCFECCDCNDSVDAFGGNNTSGAIDVVAGRNGKGNRYDFDTDTFLVSQPGVRRLTPRECERLMGWPDNHTRWTADGREIPDSHRYRLCGNGVIATVTEWLGHRLVRADSWES